MTEGKELRTVAKIFYQSSVFFVQWLMLAAVVGSIVGVMGVLFHFSVEKATELRTEFPWLLYLLPLGGVLIALLYQKSGMAKDMGTNTIIEAVRGEHPLRMRTAPLSPTCWAVLQAEKAQHCRLAAAWEPDLLTGWTLTRRNTR